MSKTRKAVIIISAIAAFAVCFFTAVVFILEKIIDEDEEIEKELDAVYGDTDEDASNAL